VNNRVSKTSRGFPSDLEKTNPEAFVKFRPPDHQLPEFSWSTVNIRFVSADEIKKRALNVKVGAFRACLESNAVTGE